MAYNYKLVSSILCYTPEELCGLFAGNKLTRKRVNAWIKSGLPTISCGRSQLIAGPELIKFLKKLNSDSKQNLEFNEFFCCACKIPHVPFEHKISVEQHSGFVHAKGICPYTKKGIMKIFKLTDFGRLKENFTLVEKESLYDSYSPQLKDHKTAQESRQLKLL